MSEAPLKEILVWVGCDDQELRDAVANGVGGELASLTEDWSRAGHRIAFNVVDSPLRAPSLLEVMDDVKPGFFDRFVKHVAEDAANTQSNEDEEKITKLAKEVKTSNHRLDVARHIVNSQRMDDVKIQELKLVLDPDISVKGKPQGVQDVIELALFGQMPQKTTDATISYSKDGKSAKTVSTF